MCGCVCVWVCVCVREREKERPLALLPEASEPKQVTGSLGGDDSEKRSAASAMIIATGSRGSN